MFGTYLTLKKRFMTFDDGPTPEITDWVLRLLKAWCYCLFLVLAKHRRRES
jgi:hypothetical protein